MAFCAVGLSVVAADAVAEYVIRAEAERLSRKWPNGGKLVGKVVFSDNFEDAERSKAIWKFDEGLTVANVREGVRAISFDSRQKDYACLEMRDGHFIPVNEDSILCVNWRARAPKGGYAPMFRIDAYDAQRNNLYANQMRSLTDPTEPSLFVRNTRFSPIANFPKGTRFIRLQFNVAPAEEENYVSAQIADVVVTELRDAATAAVARGLRGTDLETFEAAPEGALLVNVSGDVVSTFPVMPTNAWLPGTAGDVLRIFDCPGETVWATAVLRSKTDRKGVAVSFSDLMGREGTDCIPARCLSAKTVKVHYQCEGTPDTIMATGTGQKLIPELLLNDDDLVRVDHRLSHTLVRHDFTEGSRYVDVNEWPIKPWGHTFSAAERPIRDAERLQPFDLKASVCKQLVLFVNVPSGARPGLYSGHISFSSGGKLLAKAEVRLKVLPFTLPKVAESFYSSAEPYTMGLYCWGELNDDPSARTVGILRRTREQMLNDIRTMVRYGIDHPILIWGASTVYDDRRFREHLSVAREAGLSGGLYLGQSDLVGCGDTSDDRAAIRRRVSHACEIAGEYGFSEVYFYGLDEAQGERLVSQRAAWKAVKDAGGKMIVSGYSGHFEKVGDLLDICVYAGDPWTENPAKWHMVGHKLWKYCTPQTGPEDPGLFRRAYGASLWARGYDGACTFCLCNDSDAWNDLGNSQRMKASGSQSSGYAYRAIAAAYPTVDRPVETLALIGLGEAIKDVRYLSLFRKLLREHPDKMAENWFKSLDFEECDLGRLRRECVEWILKLRGGDEIKGKAERRS